MASFGRVRLSILKGNDLVPMNPGKTSNAFVRASIGQSTFDTEVVEKSCDPVFTKGAFVFPACPVPTILTLSVFNKILYSDEDEFMGSSTVTIFSVGPEVKKKSALTHGGNVKLAAKARGGCGTIDVTYTVEAADGEDQPPAAADDDIPDFLRESAPKQEQKPLEMAAPPPPQAPPATAAPSAVESPAPASAAPATPTAALVPEVPAPHVTVPQPSPPEPVPQPPAPQEPAPSPAVAEAPAPAVPAASKSPEAAPTPAGASVVPTPIASKVPSHRNSVVFEAPPPITAPLAPANAPTEGPLGASVSVTSNVAEATHSVAMVPSVARPTGITPLVVESAQPPAAPAIAQKQVHFDSQSQRPLRTTKPAARSASPKGPAPSAAKPPLAAKATATAVSAPLSGQHASSRALYGGGRGSELLQAAVDGVIEPFRKVRELDPLLAHGFTSVVDYSGRNALHLAAWHGHVDILDLLVGPGTPAASLIPQLATRTGNTVLHCAALGGSPRAVEWLQFQPPAQGMAAVRNNRGLTPYECALEAGNLDSAKVLSQ